MRIHSLTYFLIYGVAVSASVSVLIVGAQEVSDTAIDTAPPEQVTRERAADGTTGTAPAGRDETVHPDPDGGRESSVMTAPAQPTGLKNSIGDSQSILFWDDPRDGTITGYEYKRKVGAGSYGAWTAMTGSSATTTYYTVGGLTNNTSYTFRIRAKAGSTAGPESTESSVIPKADIHSPSLGTVTVTSTDGSAFGAVRHLATGHSVTLVVPVIDTNPPTTAPTVKVKFGASGTERTLTAGTTTLSIGLPTVVTATYRYPYTIVSGDEGTLRYKITGVRDSVPTPNSMTDQTTFTEITGILVGTPVTGIGIQAGSDSGADDNITNDKTAPVIEFTPVSGASVTAQYRKEGGSWLSGGVTLGTAGVKGTVTLPDLTGGDGVYEVVIGQTVSGKPEALVIYRFVLDTTAPVIFPNTSPYRPVGTPLKIAKNGDTAVSLTQNDQFGTATAFSADGNLLAVGARGTDSNKGAVYLFEKRNNTWTQVLKIFDKTGAAGAGELDIPLDEHDNFGDGVALSGDGTILAVGAFGDDDGDGNNSGSVYIFEKSGGAWSQSLKMSDNAGGTGELPVTLDEYSNFGASVSLSADASVLAVGARGTESQKGTVYLFERIPGGWSQVTEIGAGENATITPPLSETDVFGSSVALSSDGTTLAVGAYGDKGNHRSNYRRGAAYVFEKRNGSWSQVLEISSDASGSGTITLGLDNSDQFGFAIDLSADGRMLAVGAVGDDVNANFTNHGATYLFEKSGTAWSQVLKMSGNADGHGNRYISELNRLDVFGSGLAFSGDGTLLAVGAYGDNGGETTGVFGAVYIFSDGGTAKSVSVTARDSESHGSTWRYETTNGNTCGSAQFSSLSRSYTEGEVILFSSESDTGARVCFESTDTAGNAPTYTLSAPLKTIDATAPTLTATRIGTGSTSEYRIRATDTSEPITGRTKDNVATGSCTAGTDTSGSGWSDYTPGEIVGTADDTNGRCVIITDAVGNSAKQHLLDNDNAIAQDFTLDLDASGTFEPNKDAILLYLYTNQGASASELTTFTAGGQTGTVASAIGKINAVKDSADTPLDMDGNGTFTANTDGIIPYLYTGQGYDATALTSFTHDNQQTTADAAITRMRGDLTPDWP